MAPKTQATSQHPHSAISASRRTRTASLALHQRRCIICHHPDREEIEEMFLHWFSPATIYRRFLLKDRYSIYRHAHATDLYQRRRRNLRCALENIIERSDECPISSNGIVRAIKAYCSLTTAGEWVEPASRVVYQTVSTSSAPADPSSAGLPRAGTASHAKVPSTTVPGTTVDGWNCRYGDVRTTVPPSSHATATHAGPGSAPAHIIATGTPLPTRPTSSVALTERAPQNMTHSSPAPDSRTCPVGPGSGRAEGVRSTPLPSASHLTTTDAPVAPRKESTQTTAPESLATRH